MASVFLSYDRDDMAKAQPIAAALEKAGHSVWWDRHIKSGAEYNTEIEEALGRADAIVVLWSERSVRSAWVRDEAAAGRDTGRLVPVTIGTAEPPLGFRQYQTTDLSKWKGRASSTQFLEMLGAVEALGGGQAKAAAALIPKQARLRLLMPALVGMVVAAILIFGLVIWRPWSVNSLPLVSVEPATEGTSARSLADDLFIKLGSLQSAEADALQLVEADSEAAPDFTFKVGGAANSGPRANLALIDREGTLLWSREFTQPSGNQADLRQQVAYSAGQVLRCATEALAPNHPKLDPSVLSLYLKGCADLSASSDTRLAIPAFRTVTEKAPRFAGGWGKLLTAELEAFKATGASDLPLQQEMRRHVAEARKVNPDLAETYLVQSWLQAPRPILGWMRLADEALEKKPDNAAILENHATGLGHVGRLREAVDDARRASEIEPLSPGAQTTLIDFLGDTGAYEAARRELNEAERLWPGASNIVQTRFWFEYNHGDPKRALAIIESGRLGFLPSPAAKSFLQARVDNSPANIALAIADARKAYEQEGGPYRLIHSLATFGRKEEAIQVLLSTDPKRSHGIIAHFFRRPAMREVRRDPRFVAIAKRYGLIDYWTATGRWPDYCFEPDLPYNCKAEAAKLS